MLGKPDDVPQNAKTGPHQVLRGWYLVSSPSWCRKQVTFETCSLGGEDAWSPSLAERLRKANWRLRPNSPERARSPCRVASIPSYLPASPRGPPGGPGPPARPGRGVRGGRRRPPAAARFPGEEQRIAQASGRGEGAEEGERRKRDLNERR